MVSSQSFGSSAVSLACITSMCPVQRFPGGHSLRLAFGSFFYPHPAPPFILPLTGSIGVGGSWLEGAGLPAMGAQLSRGKKVECLGWAFVAVTAFVAFMRRSGWSFL